MLYADVSFKRYYAYLLLIFEKRGMPAQYILILILVIFPACYVYFSRRACDPYGTFHVSFNQVPGNSDPPRTEWLNMGFWKVQRTTTADSHSLLTSSDWVGYCTLPRSVSRYFLRLKARTLELLVNLLITISPCSSIVSHRWS